MPDIDFFNFFRYVLGTIVTIYATVVIAQSTMGWYKWLVQSDRYIGLVRRYVILAGLRLRFKTFWGDVLVCILLSVLFMILWHAHSRIYQLEDALKNVRQPVQPISWRGS